MVIVSVQLINCPQFHSFWKVFAFCHFNFNFKFFLGGGGGGGGEFYVLLLEGALEMHSISALAQNNQVKLKDLS